MTIRYSVDNQSEQNDLAVSRMAGLASSFFPLPLLLILIAAMGLSGCGGGSMNGGDPSAKSTIGAISVLPAASTITVGSTEQLQATATDQNGNVMPGITFTFSSSSSAAGVSQPCPFMSLSFLA